MPRRFFCALFRLRCRCCVCRRLVPTYSAKIALCDVLACREFNRRKPSGEFFSDILNNELFRMKNACENERDKQEQNRLDERNRREKPKLAQDVSVESLPGDAFTPEDRQFAYDLLGAIAATKPHRGDDAEEHSQSQFVRHPTNKEPDEQRMHQQKRDV